MNERIRELWVQCVAKHTKDPMNWQTVADEFALLIVQDMLLKAIASILITDVVMEEKGQIPTSEDYIRAINKDFGVEE